MQHPRYRLILAANRDEFYARPTRTASFWEENPEIVGGKDLTGGGTWLGVSQKGNWAALTNYRVPFEQLKQDSKSRGALTLDFLQENISGKVYLEQVAQEDALYNGYNLLLGEGEKLMYYSNMEKQIKTLVQGRKRRKILAKHYTRR